MAQTSAPEDVVLKVDDVLKSRINTWNENAKWAVGNIKKPDIAKTNSVIAAAGMVGVGMQAVSAFMPSMAARLAIPTFLFADAASAFQRYYRQRMQEAQKDLDQAATELESELRNRLDEAGRNFKSSPQLREIRDFMASHAFTKHGVDNKDKAYWVAQKAVEKAKIGGHSVIPVNNGDLETKVTDYYGRICQNAYEVYKRLHPETVSGATYPPFMRAANRSGKFRSIGELEAFCVEPKRNVIGCEPDVEGYVVQPESAGSKDEKSDFTVLLGHAWMLKLVPRRNYQRAARATAMPVTHVEIVPVERKPIRPVWTGVEQTKRALAEAIDREASREVLK